MNTKKSKKTLIVIILFSVLLAVAFIISACLYFPSIKGVRRSFVFSSAETGVFNVENRYVPAHPEKDEIAYYVDEILLGPQNERSLMLFRSGTKVLSCIKNDDVLYIDLSPDLLKMGINVMEIKDGIELLRSNVLRNFKQISKVEILINGKYAYENF